MGDTLSDENRQEFLRAIKEWIAAGTPPLQKVNLNDVVQLAEIEKLALIDFEASPRSDARYISFLPIYNNLKKRGNLSAYEQALSKLVNSVSWQEKIVIPKSIDANKILFRINIKDYNWSAEQWEELTNIYPFGLQKSKTLKTLSEKLNVAIPIVRGDWFIDTLSKPPFYEFFARIPDRQSDLENMLGINVESNYLTSKALRAGFVNSGVSQNNRIIERHKTRYGAFWISYDFARSNGTKNIFQHPLGPFSVDKAIPFVPDGGEIIFNLPNGLQAYMLVNSKGNRIDTGHSQVVSDPSRPDRLVRNGVSCMGCHSQGMIFKSDQISLSNQISSAPFERIKTLYGQREKFSAEMSGDRQRFLEALKQAGIAQNSPEVITEVVGDYEASLDEYDFKTEIQSEYGIDERKLSELVAVGDAPALKELLAKNKFLVHRKTFETLHREVPTVDFEEPQSQLADTSSCESKTSRNDPLTIVCLDGIGVGDVVLNGKVSGVKKAIVVGISSDKLFALQFLEGELQGRIVAGWGRDALAVQKGCVEDICVGQIVLHSRASNVKAKVIGISKNSTFVVQFLEGGFKGENGSGWAANTLKGID